MQTRRRGRGAPVMCPVHGSKAVAITKSTLRATQRFKSSEGSTEGVRNPEHSHRRRVAGSRRRRDARDPRPRRRHRRSPSSPRAAPRTPTPPSPPPAAPSTQGEWPRTPVAERAALLRRVADLLAARPRGARPHWRAGTPARPWRRAASTSTDVTDAFRYFADLVADESGGPGRRRRSTRHAQRRRARARRRLRADHALELPAAPGQLEDRPGARRGQHLRDQAQRDHPADDRRT